MTPISLLAETIVAVGWITLLRRRLRAQTAAPEKALAKATALEHLTEAMHQVTVEKDFSARVSLDGCKETAQLGVEFNNIVSELQLSDLARKQAEERLRRQALTDELTGLPNRRLLTDGLSQTLATAERTNRRVALLHIDLDGFKQVNDSVGHSVGDLLLSQVSERLRARIRRSDTLARLGGDEFAVVLTMLHAKDEARTVANDLLAVLSLPFAVQGHDITIGTSIGISVFPDISTDASDLLQQADSAMYLAKRAGKNRVRYYTPELGSSVRGRLSLENQLRGAMARGKIHIHHQPEFDIASERLVRFEALARWTHPTLGSIPPSKFIPIAEEPV